MDYRIIEAAAPPALMAVGGMLLASAWVLLRERRRSRGLGARDRAPPMPIRIEPANDNARAPRPAPDPLGVMAAVMAAMGAIALLAGALLLLV